MSLAYLFVPATDSRKIDKALTCGADVVIADLEDGVAGDQKAIARLTLRRHLCPWTGRNTEGVRLWVRCNAIESTEFAEDATLINELRPDAVMIPKCESADDIAAVAAAIPQGRLIPLLETAKGIHRIESIVTASPRIPRVAFGSVDFALDMGVEWTPAGGERMFAMGRIALVSRALGLEPPIDAVFALLDDAEAFRCAAHYGRAMGFYGKMIVHPKQLEILRDVYQPTTAQLEWAEKVIQSYEKSSTGALRIDGKLVDMPMVSSARRLLGRRV